MILIRSEQPRSLVCVVHSRVRAPSVPFSSLTQSCPTLQPHGLRHTRPPCSSPTPRAYLNSCPLSRWCHPTISSSVIPFSSRLQSLPESGSFSSESVLCIRQPKYLSFSFNISPSNEYSGLISFRMDWLDLLAVRGTLWESNVGTDLTGGRAQVVKQAMGSGCKYRWSLITRLPLTSCCVAQLLVGRGSIPCPWGVRTPALCDLSLRLTWLTEQDFKEGRITFQARN